MKISPMTSPESLVKTEKTEKNTVPGKTRAHVPAPDYNPGPIFDDPNQLLLFEGAHPLRIDPERQSFANIQVERQTLRSGIDLHVITPDFPFPTSVQVLFGVGSAADPIGKEGLAHFLEHMLFTRPKGFAGPIATQQFMDENSLRFTACTTSSYTKYGVDCPARQSHIGIEHLAKMLQHPDFGDEEVDRERRIIHAERLERAAIPLDTFRFGTWLHFLRTGQTGTYDVVGTIESASRISETDLQNFWRDHYMPSKAIMVVLAKQSDSIVRAIDNAFVGRLPRDDGSITPAPENIDRSTLPRVLIQPMPFEGVSVQIAFPGLKLTDPDYPAQLILRQLVLGTTASTFVRSIRLDEGLAYATRPGWIHSPLDMFENIDLFAIDTDKARRCIDLIYAAADSITRGQFTAKQLEVARELARAQLPSSWLPDTYSEAVFHFGKTLTPYKQEIGVEYATHDDIVRVANKIFDRKKVRFGFGGAVDKFSFTPP